MATASASTAALLGERIAAKSDNDEEEEGAIERAPHLDSPTLGENWLGR